MNRRQRTARSAGLAIVSLIGCALSAAQGGGFERVFPQSKAEVESVLKAMQPSMAGRLPVLDGFAMSSDQPLERYQRGYYQATPQVAATPAGGSWVRINTKITAWYSDSEASHSGYKLLQSNGRLEADILDRLAEQLALRAGPTRNPPDSPPQAKPAEAVEPNVEPKVEPKAEATTQSPATKFPSPGTFSSTLTRGLSSADLSKAPIEKTSADSSKSALQAEADELQEILKNQAHPKNLVAVKKSGTPVVASPSLTAKPLFLASMHDEFELLDFNADWVHVKVSGLSRGWIWRNSLEMPEGIPDTATHTAPAAAPAADLFRVTREEAAPFPGDWQPLRGKSVKIISVQKVDDNEKGGGPQDKLEYAKYLLGKNYAELLQKPQELAGIVLIFDSADGGMIAATAATLQQWKSGTLSDSALWHNCFFDPPETFSSSPASGTQ